MLSIPDPVSFAPKNEADEAGFICHETQLDALLQFLADKHVVVIRHGLAISSSNKGREHSVEVKDVSDIEGKALEKKFNDLLS